MEDRQKTESRAAGVRIAIALPLDTSGALRPGRTTHYAEDAYIRALSEAGAEVTLLPAGPRSPALLEPLDGLVFPGGADFPPDPRGGKDPYPPDTFRLAPVEQRAADAVLLTSARKRRLPVLGICYGMQLMALEAAGKLVAHIPADMPQAANHQMARSARHPVGIEPTSRLARWLGNPGLVQVNSRHHQAVALPGSGWPPRLPTVSSRDWRRWGNGPLSASSGTRKKWLSPTAAPSSAASSKPAERDAARGSVRLPRNPQHALRLTS